MTRHFASSAFSLFVPRNRQLERWRKLADEHPDDPNHQTAYLRALVQRDPAEVVSRLEMRRFAVDVSTPSTYRQALKRCHRPESTLDDATLTARIDPRAAVPYAPHSQYSAYATPYYYPQYAYPYAYDYSHHQAVHEEPAPNDRGDKPDSPLYVRVVENKSGSLFSKLVSTCLLAYITYYTFNLLTSTKSGNSSSGASFSPFSAFAGSSSKEIQPENVKTRFSDVRGCDEAKVELMEIVDVLTHPEKFNKLGGKLPRGILLTGPPGTGKTLLARAVAGEAGVPFFFSSGSEFDEMFVGVGARRIRDLFTAAKRKQPCLIFIDEIDAVGGKRKARWETNRMSLNQLLVELDGFNQSSNIVVIAATNEPDMLDKALVRPGRFDKVVSVSLPDLQGRKEILDLYLKKTPKGPDVDASVIARGTPGCSGAELANLVNQAAIQASLKGSKYVSQADLEWAKDKVLLGPERKSRTMSEKERQLTAYHEGGHALVAFYTAAATPLYKATILPRGNALGITFQLPEDDRLSVTKSQLLAELDVSMGGRVAEELIFGPDNVTTGASSDLQRATRIAQNMVLSFGMSDKVGKIQVQELEHLSPDTRRVVDQEIKDLLESAYNRAKTLLTDHQQDLHTLAKALLQYETLSLPEIQKILKGHGPSKEEIAAGAAVAPAGTGLAPAFTSRA